MADKQSDKTQNLKDLRGKNTAELRGELARLRREQFMLRMQRASGQLGQSHLLGLNRKSIAQVKTVMTEKNRHG